MNSNKQEEVFSLLPAEEHLWDKFANEALNGLVVGRNSTREGFSLFQEAYSKTTDNIENHAQFMAFRAFDIADAMILERRKRKKTSIPYYPPVELTQPKKENPFFLEPL